MTKEKEGEHCATCYFYHHGDGECRRYAPKPVWEYQIKREIERNDFNFARPWWPVMGDDDWCGEFKKEQGL